MPQNVSRTNPCPICGKPDMCFSNDRGTDGIVRVCGRIHKDMVQGFDGRAYKMIPSKNSQYTSYVDYEEDLKRQEQRRKDWCEAHGKRYVPKNGIDLSGFTPAAEEPWEYDSSIVKPLSHEMLDKILRPWLIQSFVLAPCHKAKLMREWKANPQMAENIFANWILRTLPPEDKVREEAPAYYKVHTAGKTRKELIADLLRICKENGLSSPKGIPGIYQDAQTGEWKINGKAGILFPVYDVKGRIYRLRLGVDTPDVAGEFDGKKGTFRFYRDMWFFDRENKPREEKSVLVWKYGRDFNEITLNGKGLPPGKADGKYVNVSSFREWKNYETHTIVNKLSNGTRSGSNVSFYRPKDAQKGIVWVTEGGKKAMVIAEVLKVAVLCLPGVQTYSKLFEPEEGGASIMEQLSAEGVRLVVVAYDADKESNEAVASAEQGLLKELFNHGFTVGRTMWNQAFGKGIDDSIMEGVMPQISVVSFE